MARSDGSGEMNTGTTYFWTLFGSGSWFCTSPHTTGYTSTLSDTAHAVTAVVPRRMTMLVEKSRIRVL